MRISTNLAAFYCCFFKENATNQPKSSDAKPKKTIKYSEKAKKKVKSAKNISLSNVYTFYRDIKVSDDPYLFKNIISHATIYVSPLFNRKLCKKFSIPLSINYSRFIDFFNKHCIIFNVTIHLPNEFKEYNFLRVTLFIEENKYVFWYNIKRKKTKKISSQRAFRDDSTSTDKFSTILALKILPNIDDFLIT